MKCNIILQYKTDYSSRTHSQSHSVYHQTCYDENFHQTQSKDPKKNDEIKEGEKTDVG